MTRPLCIYHARCTDGIAAAWCVWKALGGDVDFFEGFYNAPPPDVSERDVIIVDFSYKLDTMREIARAAKHTILLDHHKSAIDDIKHVDRPMLWNDWRRVDVPDGVPGIIGGILDMDRSGAGLAWDYFFPGEARPWLVDLVEVRDLWKRGDERWPDARLAHAYINSFSLTVEGFEEHDFLSRVENGRDAMLGQGAAILRQHDRDVEELVGAGRRRMKIAGHDVPAANMPHMMASDAGHLLAKGEPFSATYFDGRDARLFSLRSHEDGVDVARIAEIYGGGGHKHASGFKRPLGWEGD